MTALFADITKMASIQAIDGNAMVKMCGGEDEYSALFQTMKPAEEDIATTK